ncbi:aldo/keto reductase, partial [candidate division KSB1 bacterium]
HQPIEKLAENMPQRVLGRTGWKTSIIGLGTMFYPKILEGLYQYSISNKESDRLLNTAIDLGVNVWETGRAYNNAEGMVGKILKNRRDEVFISTKSVKIKAGKAGVLRDLEISLANLNTDHVDCFMLHNCSSSVEIGRALAEGGSYEGLKQAQKEGKTRFIGITTHHVPTLMYALRNDLFDVHVVPNNAMSREFERALKLAHKKNAVVYNMKPFGCGDTGVGLLNYDSKDPMQLKKTLTDEECLRWVLSTPGVTVAIPGSATMDYLKRNIAIAATFKPLTNEERKDIAERADRIRYGVCGLCEKPCEDVCQNDVPISFLMSSRQWNKRFLYDYRGWGDKYGGFENGYWNCEDCGECEKVCSRNYSIREEMKQEHELLSDARAKRMNH